MRHRIAALPLTAALLLAPACARDEAPAPAGPAVVNPALGIALATVPPSLEVEYNEGTTLTLTPVEKGRGGQLWVEVHEPAAGGVNLVEAVHAHQAQVEAKPSGKYVGARELVTPLGPAYWSRGRWSQDGVTVEETRIFALHPDGRRMLVLAYVYPYGDDSGDRVRELVDVLAEVEAPPAPQG